MSKRFLVVNAILAATCLLSLAQARFLFTGGANTRGMAAVTIAAMLLLVPLQWIVPWAMRGEREAARRAAEALRQAERRLARAMSTNRARRRRNARMRRAGGFCDDLARAHRRALYGGLCYVCAQPGGQMDHVIAIARGGTNWPANLRPICPRCNQSKGAKDWRPVVARAAGLPRPAQLP